MHRSVHGQLDSQQLVASLTAKRMLGQQFQEILGLKSSTNPTFVADMVRLYIGDASQKLVVIERILSGDQIDEGQLDHVVHQLKGCSATIGAEGALGYCISLRRMSLDHQLQQARSLFGEFKAFMQDFFGQLQLLADLEDQSIAQSQRRH